MKTLKEVCQTYNISRRAIQNYEKVGLIEPSSKNKMGHLLYDECTQNRIQNIHNLQRYGFSIKEIIEVIDANETVLKSELIKKRELLYERRVEMDSILIELEQYIESL